MSRSLGVLLFTTCPPMRSSPELMSSRPPIMFTVVDLPHPDGPTRMTNSPPPIFRLKPLTATAPAGNRLWMCSGAISAICLSLTPLALDRAGRQPGHDPALEEQHEDYDRDGDDHRGGRDRTRRNGEYRSAAEVLHGGRRRPRADRRGERDRQQEVVPASEENQDGRGDHSRRGERGDDLDERLVGRGAADLGGLLQLPGDP